MRSRRSVPETDRKKISDEAPSSVGPNAVPIWPDSMSEGTARPSISRIESPRASPASEAGLSGNTCRTRSSSPWTLVENPKPMNWLSL
jgi:hypothetical protein